MNAPSVKPLEAKQQSTSHNGMFEATGTTDLMFEFIDHRPQVVVQKRLNELIHNSPQSVQTVQLQALSNKHTARDSIQRKENDTGLPDGLKTGIENLSGFSMDDVKVHYNSDKPAQLQAHAYAQGTNIYIAPGQKRHLPHEAWHVVQQKQKRVKPTMQLKGKVNINDNTGLEKEADLMGAKACRLTSNQSELVSQRKVQSPGLINSSSMNISGNESGTIQRQTTDLFAQHTGGREGDLDGEIKSGPLMGCMGLQVLIQDAGVNVLRFGLHSGGDGTRSQEIADDIVAQIERYPARANGAYDAHLAYVKPPTRYRRVRPNWIARCFGAEDELIPVDAHLGIIASIKAAIVDRDDMNLVGEDEHTYAAGQWMAYFNDDGTGRMEYTR